MDLLVAAIIGEMAGEVAPCRYEASFSSASPALAILHNDMAIVSSRRG
jgi:hypothetical protein